MNSNYTEQDVAQGVEAFTRRTEKDHWDATLFGSVLDDMECDPKEMNRLFARYLYLKEADASAAGIMDETMIRFSGWSFNTYLAHAFRSPNSEAE
jgi:hypothetical protein